MLARLLYIVAFLLCTALAEAQTMRVTRRVTSAEGLSNDFVLSLCVDGNGYVWAATESGLNRIAGRWCRVLPTDSSHNGQRVAALYYHAASGRMLIGTETGLCTYDAKKGEVVRPEGGDLLFSSVEDIAPAGDGRGVWVVYGNGRVQYLDCSTMSARDQQLAEYLGNRCCMDDGAGLLYIGHSQLGMSIVSLSDGSQQRFLHQPDDERSLPGNNVRCIMKDSGGRIWVGTDHGLALFNPMSGQFTQVKQEGNHDENVYDIHEMQDGTLWVASDMGGLRVLNLRSLHSDGELCYENVSVQSSSINVRSIAQDEFGNVWLGNHSNGVDFISAQRMPLGMIGADSKEHMAPVYSFAADSKGRYWIGCEDELSVWDADKRLERWPVGSMANREHSFPRSLLVDKHGDVWLGMEDEGVVLFHPETGRFERIDIGHDASDIHSFGEDAEGRVWIGSEYGVYSYKDGHVTYEDAISRITNNAPVTAFLWMSSEDLFLSTQGTGAYIINLPTKQYKSLRFPRDLPTDKVNHAIRDRERGLWLGTAAGLVHIGNPMQMDDVHIYDSHQGLADNHVRALQQDAAGRIWLSTFSGISCLDRQRGRFYNYSSFGNIYLNGFAIGAAITSVNGSVMFGSANGLCWLNPMDFGAEPQASQVQIITCEAYNPVGSDTQIQRLTADEHGQVTTSHDQNTLRLAFTLRNFAQQGRDEYSYMMKGMDNKWYYINNDQDVVFRGLSPGHYTFILRGKLKSQDWDEATQAELKIYIRPPFWRSWWAYLVYALAVAAWLWYAQRSYKRKLMLRNSLEMQRRENQQKQELNEERLRFFTNVTHELRTPLTLILGPLEDLMDDQELSQASKRRVSMIQKSAYRLRDLINGILEFRKTETQNRRLTVARGDLGQFLREICLNYKELYRNPKVQFTYDIPDDLPLVYFDSEIVATVINNFLSNAIKYTEHGSITVTARVVGEMLNIAVADTGFGISREALPHIFDRYYQAKGSHQASGTGIGLALVKSLADLHQARLSVESDEGKGSSFNMALNINSTYPNALHKEDQAQATATAEPPADADDEATEATEQQTLLIVEDNDDIRQYIADSFGEDFRILQASNGEDGLLLAQEQMPDVIVSDIMMPKMNGIEMTRRIKDDLSTSHIPIILLTAKVADEDKEEGYDSGADSYLTKPFTAKLLASRISNLLMARRRLAELLTSRRVAAPAATAATAVPAEEEQPAETPKMSRLDQEFIERLDKVISENIMSEDLDMAFMTDKMAMSHSTFYRKVKALTGLTAKEYIRKFRLQHCYQLLESGDYNVTEAAMMTGFNQLAHFRDVFRKEFGKSPSEVLKKSK